MQKKIFKFFDFGFSQCRLFFLALVIWLELKMTGCGDFNFLKMNVQEKIRKMKEVWEKWKEKNKNTPDVRWFNFSELDKCRLIGDKWKLLIFPFHFDIFLRQVQLGEIHYYFWFWKKSTFSDCFFSFGFQKCLKLGTIFDV